MNHFKKKNNKLEKLRGMFFQVGLIIAGALTLIAFEWMSPINPYDLPDVGVIYEDEWDMPTIIPEKEIEKPEVKFTEVQKKSEIIEIVEKIIEPALEPTNPKPEPKFDPTKWETEPPADPNPAPLPIAEKMPEFKGGIEKLFEYLGSNLKYPEHDKDVGIQGTVYVQFVVDKKGEIRDVKVLRGVSKLIDKEALRVVKAMPRWKPGKQSGRAVSVIYNLPIKFKIKG